MNKLTSMLTKGVAVGTLGFVLAHYNQDIDRCKGVDEGNVRNTLSLTNEPLWDGQDIQQNRVDYGVFIHQCRDGRTVATTVERYKIDQQGNHKLHSVKHYDRYGKEIWVIPTFYRDEASLNR